MSGAIDRLRASLSGAPLYPLAVLFGLNAVDELDRTAFAVLIPEIQDDLGLDLTGMLTLIAVVTIGALALQVPIATWADRAPRVPLAIAGAVTWGVFSFLTGIVAAVWALAIVRVGSGVGRAVVDPTHNSLLADYYDVGARPRVYSIHRAGNAVGAFVGPLAAGLLAAAYGWRLPFLVLAAPTFVFVVLAMKLREPVRGAHERRAMGASEDAVLTEEEPPSFAEGWRLVWRVGSLRRIWYALPFIAAAFVGFAVFAALLYDDVFGLDERARGFVAAGVEPLQLVGLVVGARIGTRLLQQEPGRLLKAQAGISAAVGVLGVVFALAPVLAVAVAAHALMTALLAALLPGIIAAQSLAIPARARALGFSVAALWIIPGLVLLPIMGAVGEAFGLRLALLLMVPVFLVGAALFATAGSALGDDIAQVWRTAAARSEVAFERRQGRSPLLVVRGVEVSYGQVQVLFGVDLDVEEGEVVALLGTNGAGKSTVLKAICGAVEADRGAVIFDGRDISAAPPHEVAARGITLMPGGAGVFPTLSVEENLGVATWLRRGDERDAVRGDRALVLERFPVLARRLGDPAGDLSGGQQQMLALGMALLGRPRLLLLDELTLGLAPTVVEQLLAMVGELRARGTTIVLVEQSVDLALRVADRAYVLERGAVRFAGSAAELSARPEVLRSVFLAGANASVAASAGERAERAVPPVGAVPALELTGLTRSFGGVLAVDDATFAVAPGEIVGIIGPNGAGKTTLFDLVSGLTSADRGRVVLGGRDVTPLPPHARALAGLGRSFQDARLFPGLTVEETVAVALERFVEVRDPFAAALHLPAAYDSEQAVTARVVELLELFGLERFRTTYVRELSTGTRRIVDLACVVGHRPTVVLLDEPSSGIAQREVEALAPLLLSVRDGLGASLVVVEHDVGLVRTLADRAVAMDQGRVVAVGPPDEVLDHDAVVASYLGPSAARPWRPTTGAGVPAGS